MNSTYLTIQGPPGTGKTYNSARMIIELMKEGKKVGVSSNSHEAIKNLLSEIEKQSTKEKFSFKGMKNVTLLIYLKENLSKTSSKKSQLILVIILYLLEQLGFFQMLE